MNVPSYGLLLASKQTRAEALPIISGESWFEIKTYVDKATSCGDPNCPRHFRPEFSVIRTSNCYAMLKKSVFLRRAKKVSINLTPKFGDWMGGTEDILRELFRYKHLKELTVKALLVDAVSVKPLLLPRWSRTLPILHN